MQTHPLSLHFNFSGISRIGMADSTNGYFPKKRNSTGLLVFPISIKNKSIKTNSYILLPLTLGLRFRSEAPRFCALLAVNPWAAALKHAPVFEPHRG